jgi:Fur family ferric uptake transcriptional regulator
VNERGTAWAERAHRELAARGHRAGGARSAVIERLAEEDGCCTAAEISEGLRSGRRAGTASVYRALTALHEAGLVHAIDLGDGERRYELVHDDGAHHHHIVCERCGRTAAFHDATLERAIHDVADGLSWSVDAHDVVLHGTCPRCAAAGERS